MCNSFHTFLAILSCKLHIQYSAIIFNSLNYINKKFLHLFGTHLAANKVIITTAIFLIKLMNFEITF